MQAQGEQTMTASLVVAAIAIVVVAYAIVLYNRLVRGRQLAAEGWSGIDVQLKRRSDLVPNLVESVKGYAGHEQATLREVTELRNQARQLPADDIAGRSRVEGLLSGAIGRLLAVVENYPDLKASQNFLQLQSELAGIENEIQMARRYYNGATRELNVMVESFPSNLVAGMFGFSRGSFFETDEASRAVPEVFFPR